jgi:spore germination protein GerM
LVALLVLLAGCGVSADREPRAIDPGDLPADLLDPTPSSSTTLAGSTTAVTVYLLSRTGDETRLVAVRRKVEDANSAGDRISALLAPVSKEEQGDGLMSSIPSDTVLLDTDQIEANHELVVDLSGALFDVQGKELANAFAQIVWTVSEMAGIDQVRFRVDGEEYRAPNAEGIEQQGAVTKADYRSLAPR